MKFVMWMFVFGVLLTFAIAMAQWFARTAAAFGIATAGSIGLALVMSDDLFGFIGITMLSWLLLFPLLLAAFGRRSRRQRSRATPSPDADLVEPVTTTRLSREEQRRHAAWDALAAEADWAASRVAVARTSSERFLRLADASGMIVETEGLAIRIRKHVPAHIETCLAHAADATPAERRHLVEEMLATVERVGAEADRIREDVIRRRGEAIEVQRRHLERDD